jgi:hypothetical protein
MKSAPAGLSATACVSREPAGVLLDDSRAAQPRLFVDHAGLLGTETVVSSWPEGNSQLGAPGPQVGRDGCYLEIKSRSLRARAQRYADRLPNGRLGVPFEQTLLSNGEIATLAGVPLVMEEHDLGASILP